MEKHDRMKKIEPAEFNCAPFALYDKGWMLLTGGKFPEGPYNSMTVSWGFLGTLWSKPVVMTVVRPQRHTLKLIESENEFTLCAFPEEFREKLAFLGRTSANDVPDKVSRCGLTPVESARVGAPAFAEANLVLECRELYCGELRAKEFFDKSLIDANYPARDFHRCFIAEVLSITGTAQYRKAGK